MHTRMRHYNPGMPCFAVGSPSPHPFARHHKVAKEYKIHINLTVGIASFGIPVGGIANAILHFNQARQKGFGIKMRLYFHTYIQKTVGRLKAPRFALDNV